MRKKKIRTGRLRSWGNSMERTQTAVLPLSKRLKQHSVIHPKKKINK
jgi:hypothetical protein